ncbi:MAG: chloride channel protein [Candidatus Hydrothermarchaeaceae archaeon]
MEGSSIKRLREDLNLSFAWRWAEYSLLIGILGGISALVFAVVLEASNQLFLGGIAGYLPPAPVKEFVLSLITPSVGVPRWLIIVVPALGGLIAGFIVYTFAPEAEGHGTDAVINAFHNKRGRLRKRVPVVKGLATAVTIGSGGSAGREGPVAQMSAGLASMLASLLRLSARDRRILIVCGTAAGIGSIFKAPIGGAFFAVEVLYRRDYEAEALIPAFISSVIAYTTFSYFVGWEPLFLVQEFNFHTPAELPFYALLGVVSGVISLIYVRTFFGLRNLFKNLGIKNHFKPALGGLMLGLMAYFLPQVMGMGYGWLQYAMVGELTLKLMLIMVFAKILATSFTIGSGGSGGVFAPSMVIGGMLGGVMGQLFNYLFPSIVTDPISFVLIGMGAFFAGAGKVPITSIIMVSEMTGGYGLLPALTLAATISYLITGSSSIYENQVPSRVQSPAHRSEMMMYILEKINVRDAMKREVSTALPESNIESVFELIRAKRHSGYPVVKDGELVGIVTLQDVEKVSEGDREGKKVEDIMSKELITIHPEATLEDALQILMKHDIGRLLVVDPREARKLLGILTKYDIIREYAKLRDELRRETE